MNYTAVIFDIVDSKKYKDRYDVQKVMIKCIEYLNELFNKEIVKKVIVTSGDEFQGLFKNNQAAYIYIRKLQLLIYPIKIRCGIGNEKVKYLDSDWQSSGIDGEAYYLAREAINTIAGKGYNNICINSMNNKDKYFNSFSLINANTKNNQSQIARLIELLIDIIYPIGSSLYSYPEGTNNEDSIEFYKELINQKISLINDHYEKTSTRKTKIITYDKINIEYLFNQKKDFDNRKDIETKLFFEDFWKRGITLSIAEAMNTTRQNIERYVTINKIKNSRNFDGALYKMLEESND